MRCRDVVIGFSCLLTAVTRASDIQLNSALMAKVPGASRSVIRIDPVEAMIDAKGWDAFIAEPTAAVSEWRRVNADAKGQYQSDTLNGGYALCTYESPSDRMAFLEETGASLVYVNGEPRAGDPYGFGYVSLPIQLKKGTNTFLFATSRGALAATIKDVTEPVSVDVRDATLPDFPFAEPDRKGRFHDQTLLGAVVVRNATLLPVKVVLTCAPSADPRRVSRSEVEEIPALTIRKVPVAFAAGPGAYKISVAQGNSVSTQEVSVNRAKAGEAYKVTFESQIDHSVQYYGVWPATKPAPGQALVLSLHGASVEGIGQARAYSQKDWATLVAPTNRRPFGFDWEETGRADALEVLGIAEQIYKPNPNRVYLTGHSMGGHGTWSIGSLFPDRFAAIMPSAGWISFLTYGGGGQFDETDPVQAILRRATNPYDTMARKQNLYEPSIYVLHGDADDNVPVTEARNMIASLTGHPRLLSHEEPGAGHWWDKDPAPGADCVDWKPGFELFEATTRAKNPPRVTFTTPAPWISNKCDWMTIASQDQTMGMSSVDAIYDGITASVVVKTVNVTRMVVDKGPLRAVVVDGQEVSVRGKAPYAVAKADGQWHQDRHLETAMAPHGIKSVWLSHPILVVPTHGDPEEQRIGYATARYWAESYWYRGNGAIDVVTDEEAVRMGRGLDGRGVVLLGRSDTNALWSRWESLMTSTVEKGRVTVGSRVATGEGLASLCLFQRPRGGIAVAAGWTGTGGARLLARSPLFLSGAAYPDLLVWSTDSLSTGSTGIIGAGFVDFNQPSTDIAWRY